MTEDWHTADIVDAIAKDRGRIKSDISYVATVVDNPYVNGLTVGYYAYMKKVPIQSISVTDFEATQPFIDNYYRFNYLIVKSDLYHMTGRANIMIEMNEYFNNHRSGWTPIAVYDLPDKTNITVYKNTMVFV